MENTLLLFGTIIIVFSIILSYVAVYMKIHKYNSATTFKKYGFYFEYKSLMLLWGNKRLLIRW